MKILPRPLPGPFTKEDGEVVNDKPDVRRKEVK